MSSQAAQGSPNEIRPQAAGDFRLLASDGNQPMAYFSPSRERTAEVGVVIIHAMRGLEPFYKSFTGRFAEVGINAITFDFYGRVAPDDRRDESFDFATYYELVQAYRSLLRPGCRRRCGGRVSAVPARWFSSFRIHPRLLLWRVRFLVAVRAGASHRGIKRSLRRPTICLSLHP